MDQHITDQENGISYTLHGDYYLPDFNLPEEDNRPIGIYGTRHRDYLKKSRRVTYLDLLTSGRLHSYLADIDEQAHDRLELITKQMAVAEGVTETLKAENQMLWVQRMNNIRNRAMEIVNSEILYCSDGLAVVVLFCAATAFVLKRLSHATRRLS